MRTATCISTDDLIENEELINVWIEVFINVVGKVDYEYMQEVALKPICEMPSTKNQFPMRKKGNRLFLGMADSLGEEGIDVFSVVESILTSICTDTNFKIRLDGAIFLKEYITKNKAKLIGTERFNEFYLPELYELCNDEESYVRIEAIECLTEVLEHVDKQAVEEEFIPNVIKTFDFENNHDEIIQRLARALGPLVEKLSRFHLHCKHKEEIFKFYRKICEHEDDENRLAGARNLPCFNMLYHKKAKSLP